MPLQQVMEPQVKKETEEALEMPPLESVPYPSSESSTDSLSTNSPRYWKFSKGRIDRRFLVWVTQVLITLTIMGYCMYMLGNPEFAEERTIWISLISTIVGNFMPNGHHAMGQQQ